MPASDSAATPAADDVSAWLAAYPAATIGTLGPDGRPTPVPAGLPLLPSQRVDDRSLLDLVHADDATHLVGAFLETLQQGHATVHARLARDPARGVAVHYRDARERFGVVLRVVLEGDGDPAAGAGGELAAGRPRLAVWHKSAVSTITQVDPATTLLLGWDAEELVGRQTLDFIHPDDHPRAIDNWMQLMAGASRHAVRLRYRCRDGSWLWLETSNQLLDPADREAGVVCQLVDISAEMAAHEALRHSEQLLRRVTETVPVGLAQLDADGSVTYVNAQLRDLLSGYDVTSMNDLATALAAEDWERLRVAIAEVVSDGADVDVDVRLQATPSAPMRLCRVALRAVLDEEQVIGALLCVVDVTELKVQAATDSLTGLANRAATFDALRVALAGSSRVGVVFIDLDGFKPVNDRFGHDTGDRVLTAVARVLQGAVREGDLVGRVGGDEFVVVCADIASPEAALDLAGRLRGALREQVAYPGEHGRRLDASIGVACVPAGSVTAEEAVSRADAAMYAAKRTPGAAPVLWSVELDQPS